MTEFNKKKVEDIVKVETHEVQDRLIDFGRESIIHTCQYCNKRILTEVEHQTTWIGMAFCLLFLIIFKIFAIPLIIMVIPLTQQTTHSCSSCLNVVGIRTFYDFFALKDTILTLKIGNFGILISRKQLLGVFIFLLFSLFFYVFFSNIDLRRGNFINENWEEFHSKCSRENFIKTSETERICFNNFRYYDVSWDGYVIRVDFEENFFARYKTSILMKMDQSEKENPDLFLKFSEYNYNYFIDDILSLKRGDHVKFNATIIFEGNHRGIPLLEVFDFKKIGDTIKINPHVHHDGRYSLGENKIIHKDNSIYKEMPNLISDEEKEIKQKETHH